MSRFVPGGTVDQPTERSEEWLKAQQAIEAKKVEKLAQSRQEEGKSLYETLQANKAAKQDAFEEASRLKNQFRALDDDEIEFLESVNASTRAKEHAVQKETSEQLSAFRELQQKSERQSAKVETQEVPPGQETWTVNKKRKREKNAALPHVKLRKSSSTVEESGAAGSDAKQPTVEIDMPLKTADLSSQTTSQSANQVNPPTACDRPAPVTALGLGAYSSDED